MNKRQLCLPVLATALALACGPEEAPPEAPAAPEAEAAPSPSPRGRVDAARIANADQEPGNWLAHGRDYREQRYSPLADITNENVNTLGVAWTFDLGSTRGVEATPIVVDGVMYVTGPWSKVYALDAGTGKLIWQFDPKVPGEWARHACCDVVNRGVAVWKGAVFVGTIDGRLISLDAATGAVNWDVLTIDRERPYTITGAPRVVKGKVIIGNGGAELGVRGYITAYDAATGGRAWRFFTVPGDPEKPAEHPEMAVATETWTGRWWEVGGGGTAWDSMVYDADLDLLYVGTGNGAPWTRVARSPGGGDNLYLSSILALRPDTGRLVWHYQTTPGDNWDYTAVQHLMLADLEIGGQPRKVIMQAPKNGFFYVLDRATGELLSAKPYIAVNWATHVDMETGRPVETDFGDYDEATKKVFPAPLGGHNWHPMAFHPDTGLVYIPARDMKFFYSNDANFPGFQFGLWGTGLDLDETVRVTLEDPPDAEGFVIAWDPVEGRELWRVKQTGFWNGGLLATAGGLLFGGAGDGRFTAWDAKSGEVEWEVRSQTGIVAAPISYAIDGTQYVAVAAGFGGGVIAGGEVADAAINDYHNEGRVIAFALGASGLLPENQKRDRHVPIPPPVTASAEDVSRGGAIYNNYCMPCHGFGVASSWLVPDLRYMKSERRAAFDDIVLRGIFSGNGMPSFAEFLDPNQTALVREYIATEAHALYEEENQPNE